MWAPGFNVSHHHHSHRLEPLRHAWGVVTAKTHGHVSQCLPLVNNKLKVDCAILCCGRLLEFARTSACACVSCISSCDAHDSFAECFIGHWHSMRKRRVTATRQLQRNTSLKQFFVLGALVPAMLVAPWWVRPPIDDGWCGQSDHNGKMLQDSSFSPTSLWFRVQQSVI